MLFTACAEGLLALHQLTQDDPNFSAHLKANIETLLKKAEVCRTNTRPATTQANYNASGHKANRSENMSSLNNMLSQRPTTAGTHQNNNQRPLSINTQAVQKYPEIPKSNSQILLPTERTKKLYE